jgi:NADH dehydrogenase
MILVAGATGMVGGEVCRLLRSEHEPVRALVRATSSPEKIAKLGALGCEIVRGDLRIGSTLETACAGARAVITTVSAMPFSWAADNTLDMVDLDGQRRLIDAAVQAGVHHFTCVTFSGNIDRPFPLRNAKRAVEAHLRASGLRYTILRPSYFAEVWLGPAVGFDYAGAKATIYGDGRRPISWISLADVARFAAASVDNLAAADATLELGGPDALSPLQVVELFEQVGGRKFALTHVPEDALEAQLAAAPDDLQRSFTGLMLCYAAGDAIPMGDTLRRFPVPLKSVATYAREALAALATA